MSAKYFFSKINDLIENSYYFKAIDELDGAPFYDSNIIKIIARLKGKVYFNIAQYTELEDPLPWLDLALEFDNCAEYWVFKSKIYKEQKQYAEAIKCANKALKIDGTDKEAKLIKCEAIKCNGQIIKDAFGTTCTVESFSNLILEDLFAGIGILEQIGLCNAGGEEITMVIGSTRCGKSTTINLLLGNSLISRTEGSGLGKKIAIVKAKDDPDELYPVIGTKSTSETTIPVKYTFDNKALWDCPGFGDTRGAQQEIINAWFVNRLFTTASKVKVINICAATSFVGTDNVKEFEKYIQQIEDVFGKKQIAGIQSVLVFTKTDSRFSAEDYKQESLKKIEELYPSNQEIQKFFENTTATKIDKVNSEGVALGKDYIPELLKLCDATAYQEMQPHVGVDDAAKVFLEENASKFGPMVVQSLQSIFRQESNQFLQALKEQIAAISAKNKEVINQRLKNVLSESNTEFFEKNELVKLQIDYFTELSKFITSILHSNEVKHHTISAIDKFKLFFKQALEQDVTSVVNCYLQDSNKEHTFGEYAYHSSKLLGDLESQIDKFTLETTHY